MAIPFTVPSEDDGELPDLNLIISNLLDAIACLRQVHSQISRVPSLSMRPTTTSRYDFDPVNSQTYHNNLSFISWINERTDSVIPGAQAATARRSRRHRTCSESSCCDESKVDGVVTDNEPDIDVIDEPPAQDWTKVGDILRKIADDFQPAAFKEDNVLSGGGGKGSREIAGGNSESNSLFGKLVPSPMKSSIWTAVICVVGWYMFRAR